MLRNRFLVLLGACFLVASAAWADEVGYVDCTNHSDPTQVFGKPRRTPEVVASLPCGERFTILVYGFYFSRIQTKDGQVGYIYSSLIAVDRGAAAVQPTPSLQTAAEKTKIPSTRNLDVKPALPTSPQPPPAPAQPAPTPAIASSAPASASSTAPDAAATPVAQPDLPAAAQPTPAQPQPAPAQPASAPTPEIASPAPAPAPSDTPAPAVQPEPAATAAQPDPPAAAPAPAPVEPAAPAIRPADTHDTGERPNASVRVAPLLELFGGYAFMRTGSGSSSTNFNGALGSFGWNFKPWLQIVGDSSYNFVTVGTTKNVLYGNHYGPRYFYRGLSRWKVTPFAEALVGGSRADVTVSGSGGYSTSQNSISYKVGGGVDYHPSRRWEIRLFDFDYYRTSFGTNAHQNNYSASAGIVLRLFGGRSE